MGLHLARDQLDEYPEIDICTDNQAAIKSIGNGNPQPAQYIIEEIRRTIKQLFSSERMERRRNRFIGRQTSLRLTWVAGHEGPTGNEAADVLAKAATEFGSSDRDLLPDFLGNALPNSVAASKQNVKRITRLDFKKWWKRSKRYRRIRAIDPSLPLKDFILNTGDLTHNQTSVLTQLRTGHAPLNQHLHRIKHSDSPYCRHCPAMIEDVPHLLLFCDRYTAQRHRLALILKRKAHELPYLLSNPKAIRHTLNFLHDTGRFKHIYGDISASLGD